LNINNTGTANHALVQFTSQDGYNNYLYFFKYKLGGLAPGTNIMQQVHYGYNSNTALFGAFTYYTYVNSATAGAETATTVYESTDSGTSYPVLGFIGKDIKIAQLPTNTLIYLDGNSYIKQLLLGASLSLSVNTLNTIQDIRSTASPTFLGLTLNSLTPSTYLYANGSNAITSRSSANFTSDVRSQFSAGTSTTLVNGVIDTKQDLTDTAYPTFSSILMRDLTPGSYVCTALDKFLATKTPTQFTSDVRVLV
jgi:hypothetical protein